MGRGPISFKRGNLPAVNRITPPALKAACFAARRVARFAARGVALFAARGVTRFGALEGLSLSITNLARRRWLVSFGQSLAMASLAVHPAVSRADAASDRLDTAIREFTMERPIVTDSTRLRIEIDALVENGNSVPIRVKAISPMTDADHVQRILILAPRNPQPQVALFHLGVHSGRAEVATRFRMAESQTLQALALFSDGRIHRARADVVVTLAACLEN